MATLKAVPMSDKRFDEVSKLVRESYPKSCILWIDEVVNPPLETAYAARKEALCKLRGSHIIKEMQLFHGTSEESAMNIARNGYDVAKNVVSAYGKGSYFARKASTSFSYMKDNQEKVSFMLLNKVLMGIAATYYGGTINTALHDNSVDTLGLYPNIVVSPYNDGAVPLYVIAFYKYAK